MKKSVSRLIAAVLSIALMGSAFVGCSGKSNEGENPDTTTNTSEASTTENTSNETKDQAPVDEKIDLGGYEIKISAWWDGTPQPGTDAGDAAIERQKEIEAKYNCKITYLNLPNAETVEKLTATALSGEPMADIIHLETNQAVPGLAAAGFLLPLNDYFGNFEDPKWAANIKKISSYNGKTYGFMTKSYSTHGIWYNKTLFKRESLPDLYELQEKGEWTWDKYEEIAKKATKDTDGDGQNDQFGLTVGYDITDHLIWSNGGSIVKEDNGKYVFNLDTDEAKEALDFVGKIWKANVMSSESQAAFEAGKAAMYGGEAWMGGQFAANMEDEVGYVFYPKGPRASDYTSVVTNTVIATFPATAKHPKEVAKVIDDLTLWDKLDDEKMDFLEGNLANEQDIETAKKMISICDLNTMDAFKGLADVYWKIVDQIKQEGASAATAVQARKQEAQAVIDAVFKK